MALLTWICIRMYTVKVARVIWWFFNRMNIIRTRVNWFVCWRKGTLTCNWRIKSGKPFITGLITTLRIRVISMRMCFRRISSRIKASTRSSVVKSWRISMRMAQAWIGRKRSPIMPLTWRVKVRSNRRCRRNWLLSRKKSWRWKAGLSMRTGSRLCWLTRRKPVRRSSWLRVSRWHLFAFRPDNSWWAAIVGNPILVRRRKWRLTKLSGWVSWRLRTSNSTWFSRITTAVSWISNGKITWFKDIPLINRSNR